MKIYQNLGMTLAAVLSFTACGSGQSTTPLAYTADTTPVTTPMGTVVTNNNGSTTYAINGGTETLTPVFTQTTQASTGYVAYTTISNTFNFNETVAVAAGDRIIINLQGSQEVPISTFSVSQSLDNFKVHMSVGGADAVLYQTGPSLYGTWSFQAAGTVSFSTDWLIGSNNGSRYIEMPIGGVSIAHCVTTAGAAMTCP